MAATWLAWTVAHLLISGVTAQSIDPLSVFVSEAYSVYTQVTSLLASAASAASNGSSSSSRASTASTSSTPTSSPATASTSPTSSFPTSSTAASASSGASAAAASATSAAAGNAGGGRGTGTNVTAIVLGCVLGALALGLLILIFLLCCRRRMRSRNGSPDRATKGGGWRSRRKRHGPVAGSVVDEEHNRHNAPLMSQAPAYRGPGEHENPFVPAPPPPRRSTPTNRVGFNDGTVADGPHVRSASRSPSRGGGLAAGAGGAALGAAAMHHRNKSRDRDRDLYDEKHRLTGPGTGGIGHGGSGMTGPDSHTNGLGLNSNPVNSPVTGSGGIGNTTPGTGIGSGGVGPGGHLHNKGTGLGAPGAAAGGAALGAAAMHHHNKDSDGFNEKGTLGGHHGGGALSSHSPTAPPYGENFNHGGLASDRGMPTSTNLGGNTMTPGGIRGVGGGPLSHSTRDGHMGDGGLAAPAAALGGAALGTGAMRHHNNDRNNGTKRVGFADSPGVGGGNMPGAGGAALGPSGSPTGSTDRSGPGMGSTNLPSHERDRIGGGPGSAAPAALGGAALGAAAMHHHNKNDQRGGIDGGREPGIMSGAGGIGSPSNRGSNTPAPGTSGPGKIGGSGPADGLFPEPERGASPAYAEGPLPVTSPERLLPPKAGGFSSTAKDHSILPAGGLVPAVGGAALGAAAMHHHNDHNDRNISREDSSPQSSPRGIGAGLPGNSGSGFSGPGASAVPGGPRSMNSGIGERSPIGNERPVSSGTGMLPAAGGAALTSVAMHHHNNRNDGNERGIGAEPGSGGVRSGIHQSPGSGMSGPGGNSMIGGPRPMGPASGESGALGNERYSASGEERNLPTSGGRSRLLSAEAFEPFDNERPGTSGRGGFGPADHENSGMRGGLLPAAGGAALGAAAMHHNDRDRVDDRSSIAPSEHRIGRKPLSKGPPSSYEPGTFPTPSTNDDAFALNKAPRRRSTSNGRRSVSRDAASANAAFDNGYAHPTGPGSAVPTINTVVTGAPTGGRRRGYSAHSRSPRRPSAGDKNSSDSSNSSSNYSDALPNTTTVHTTVNTTVVPSPDLPSDIPPTPRTRSRRNSALGMGAPPAALGSYQNRNSSQSRSRSPNKRRPISYPPLPGTSSSHFNTREPINQGPNAPRYDNEPFPSVHDNNMPPPGIGQSATSDRAIVGDNGYPHMGVPRRKSGGSYDYMGEGPYAQQALPVDSPPVPSSTDTSDDSTWRLSSGMPGGWGRPKSSGGGDRDSGLSGMSGSTAVGGNGNGGPGRRFRASDVRSSPSEAQTGQENPQSMMARGRYAVEPEWSGNGGYDGYDRHTYDRGVGQAM